MSDQKISDFTDGGDAQPTDMVAAARAGDNVKVFLGTMATEDADDYMTEAEVTDLVNTAPTVIDVTGNLTLDATTHNGAEIYLRPHTGSPSGYIVTVPYSLPVGFRCSFINLFEAGEVLIKLATGSPNDTLNGVASGTATFQQKYSGAYMRKTATGELIIVGGGLSVS